jgi:ribose/xylose/arabinose/galactoside ABC-type transport system permease subunit
VILMLASERPSNAIWWTAGWTLSTFATGLAVVLVLGEVDVSGSRANSTAACVVQVLLGALLLAVAARVWRRRPARTGVPNSEPRWLDRIGRLRPLVAFGLGAFWINAALVVAAALETLRADLPTGESVAVCAWFAVVCGAVQGGIIVAVRVRPARASAALQGLRWWITRNQQAAIVGAAILLALWVGGRGIAGLAA